MKEGTNPWIAFVSNCNALFLSVESEERKLLMTPTMSQNFFKTKSDDLQENWLTFNCAARPFASAPVIG